MELKHRTRGNSSPFGKAKLYFSCHPRDFEKFFDRISDEILEREDCAIWYDDKTAEPEIPAEFLKDLSQMQLFIIPVTKAFLCEHNRAYDMEFAYAMEKNIPVLPIMQERGLDELFNEKCSDIQFLDLHNRETVQFLYEDRLGQYLSDVLVGDELTKEVRAAFDAHIFLSYRKKDKEYAQQLMQLIHNIDICRDVAIWYDEYLIAGENFNHAIENAIKNCDLFAMAVTPNLVTEENYVMTTEYPLAREKRKPILPVELVETSHSELMEKYEGLPACIGKADQKNLEKTLEKYLQPFPKRKRENDPRHNFLIGIAYLSGIDVEVNKKKGLALITSAAEAGLPEAMARLANLYRMGDGTEKDYDTALEWMKRLVVAEGEAFYANPQKGYDAYLDSLLFFAACHFLCGNLDMAEGAYLKIEEVIAAGNSKRDKDAQILYAASIALGDICIAKGEFQPAYQYYEDACRSIETAQTDEHFQNLTKGRTLEIIYQNMGFICKKLKKYPEAWEHLKKALSIMEEIVSKTGENYDKQALAEIYMHMGTLCELQHDLPGAHQYHYQCLSICEAITKESSASMGDWLYLAASYEKIGTIYTKEGEFAQANKCYGFCLAIHEAAETETTGSLTDKQTLGNICLHYGILQQEQGNFQEAEKYFKRSIQIHKGLWEKSKILQSQHVLAITYYELGCLGDGNLYYLELASQMLAEEALSYADCGMSLSAAVSSVGNIGIIRNDAKKRIRAIKRKERKAGIASIFKKKL